MSEEGSMQDYMMMYVLSGESMCVYVCMSVVLVCADILAGVCMMKM